MENKAIWSTTKSEVLWIITLSNAKHGESIVIGLAASSTSKGPQLKTTEPKYYKTIDY